MTLPREVELVYSEIDSYDCDCCGTVDFYTVTVYYDGSFGDVITYNEHFGGDFSDQTDLELLVIADMVECNGVDIVFEDGGTQFLGDAPYLKVVEINDEVFDILGYLYEKDNVLFDFCTRNGAVVVARFDCCEE